MRNYIVLLLIPLVFACEKRKEKKFTGTFEGVEHKKSYAPVIEDGNLTNESIITETSKEITVEVLREGDYLYADRFPDAKFNIKEIGFRQSSLGVVRRGGGGKYLYLTITENGLSYRTGFNSHNEYYGSNSTFSGIKIEE